MAIGGIFRNLFKFTSHKIVLPLCYNLNKHKKTDENKVVFIEVRVNTSNNFTLIKDALEKEGGYNMVDCCLDLGFSSIPKYLKNCLNMVREVATAKYVFLNEASSAYGCLPLKEDTVTIQTWHACGAFKKFGRSTVDLQFGGTDDEYDKYPPYANLDYITVSSPEVVWAYEEAMNIKPDSGQQVIPIGISRTDIYFDEKVLNEAKERLCKAVPQASGKKIILYAPTFRGQSFEARIPDRLNVSEFYKAMDDDCVLLIKHHPLAKDTQEISEECKDFAFDITHSVSIDDALMSADICITDYSSLVFEYCLLDRPMIFFAYDLNDYIDERGFYYPFEEFCPGPIVSTTKELAEAVNSMKNADLSSVRAFRKRFMTSCDGHVTERILEIIKSGKIPAVTKSN